MTVKDSSTRSGDQAKTNQELEQRVSELERLLSKHDACIRGHRNQLKQQQRNRSLHENFEKAEVTLIHLTHSKDPEAVCKSSD